jgi:hypothetical protein
MRQGLLAVTAIVLSLIAIAVSIIPPMYNILSTSNRGKGGVPSFKITNFSVGTFDTYFFLWNNGTATAHNIEVDVGTNILEWYGSLEAHEFVAELKNGSDVPMAVPWGTFNAAYLLGNSSKEYEVGISISCDELDFQVSFYFPVELNETL